MGVATRPILQWTQSLEGGVCSGSSPGAWPSYSRRASGLAKSRFSRRRDHGLLLLPPLLTLPQVGRGVLGSGTAGRVCALRAMARAHPCPRRWRWVSWKAAATPRTSESGGGGAGRRREGLGGGKEWG